MKRLLYIAAGLIVSMSLAANWQLREGKPIGFKNPAETCWLNATITMLFGGQSPLAAAILEMDPKKIKDPFARTLYNLIADMHNPGNIWLSYRDKDNNPGPFWQELKKKIKGVSFDTTSTDIEALETLLNGARKAIPKFDTTFGARALGNIFNKKLRFNALEVFESGTIALKTFTDLADELELKKTAAKKDAVPPRQLWIKCNAELKTPIKFALGPAIETLVNTDSDRFSYRITGLTVYKVYQSVLESGEKSEEKIHYAALIPSSNKKEWFLVDDSVVTPISARIFATELARDGKLVIKHTKVEYHEDVWYPSILQYSLLEKPVFIGKKIEKSDMLKKKQEEEDYKLALQLLSDEEEILIPKTIEKENLKRLKIEQEQLNKEEQEKQDLAYAKKLQEKEEQEYNDLLLARKLQEELEEN